MDFGFLFLVGGFRLFEEADEVFGLVGCVSMGRLGLEGDEGGEEGGEEGCAAYCLDNLSSFIYYGDGFHGCVCSSPNCGLTFPGVQSVLECLGLFLWNGICGVAV